MAIAITSVAVVAKNSATFAILISINDEFLWVSEGVQRGWLLDGTSRQTGYSVARTENIRLVTW